MKKSTFSHHSGGVVQVRHARRHGVVPEALLEDKRLALDSRLVAAWLAVKQDGWQILVGVLRCRLACGDQKMMGKDLWQRIARELENAGYLTRQRVNGPAGQWNWHITFHPAPDDSIAAGIADNCSFAIAGFAGSGEKTMAGSAAAGSIGAAWPGAGLPGDAQPGHKVIPRKVIQKSPTTTTKRARAADPMEEPGSSGLDEQICSQELYYPQVSTKELADLKKLIPLCRIDVRQDVLDEVEGIRQCGGIKRGVVPLARALIAKVASDEFSLSVGHGVLAQREKRQQHALAIQVSTATSVESLLPMSEAVIAALPPNIARRVRDQATARADGSGSGFSKQKNSV